MLLKATITYPLVSTLDVAAHRGQPCKQNSDRSRRRSGRRSRLARQKATEFYAGKATLMATAKGSPVHGPAQPRRTIHRQTHRSAQRQAYHFQRRITAVHFPTSDIRQAGMPKTFEVFVEAILDRTITSGNGA